jgi:hypothetical protein
VPKNLCAAIGQRVQGSLVPGTDLATSRNSMQKYLSVTIRKAGVVHINCESGHMFWEEDNLDPVSRQYVKKYLVQEGFVDLALGVLDPQPTYDADLFLDEISNPI